MPGRTAELVDLAGHSLGHAGVWVPAARVAFVGDTVSDLDPPALPGTFTGAAQYVRTLARLRELVTAADVVVPVTAQSATARRPTADWIPTPATST